MIREQTTSRSKIRILTEHVLGPQFRSGFQMLLSWDEVWDHLIIPCVAVGVNIGVKSSSRRLCARPSSATRSSERGRQGDPSSSSSLTSGSTSVPLAKNHTPDAPTGRLAATPTTCTTCLLKAFKGKKCRAEGADHHNITRVPLRTSWA